MNDLLRRELEEIRSIVWEYVQTYLPVHAPEQHYDLVREYPRRQGKYLRAALVLWGCELFGGSRKQAVRLAAAIQLAEDWLLIHDDIEDHSSLRRGQLTLHRLSTMELALNAGDALHLIMWQVVGDIMAECGLEQGLMLHNKLNHILITTTEGQYEELSWIATGRVDITEAEYLAMIDKKAGYYSVFGPLQLGALCAGITDTDLLDSIADWGTPAGRAFQIRDDVMNLVIDSSVQGKVQAEDLIEGKRTLLLIDLLQACTPAERAFVTRFYQEPHTQNVAYDKERVLELLQQYGCIERVAATAREYAIQAGERFREHREQYRPAIADQLERLLLFLAERTQ